MGRFLEAQPSTVEKLSRPEDFHVTPGNLAAPCYLSNPATKNSVSDAHLKFKAYLIEIMAFALEFDRAPIDRSMLWRGQDGLTLSLTRALDLHYLAVKIRLLHDRATNKTWSIEYDIARQAGIIKDEVIRPAEVLGFDGWCIWYIMDMLCTFSEQILRRIRYDKC